MARCDTQLARADLGMCLIRDFSLGDQMDWRHSGCVEADCVEITADEDG